MDHKGLENINSLQTLALNRYVSKLFFLLDSENSFYFSIISILSVPEIITVKKAINYENLRVLHFKLANQ